MKIAFFSMILACFLSSCYQNEDGCLDPKAVNFSPESDEDCCCTYPQLKIEWIKRYDTLSFSTSSIYALGDISDSVQILVHRMYLSEVELNNHRVEDKIELDLEDELVDLVDDVQIFRTENSVFNIGQWTREGQFDALSLDLGLSDSFCLATLGDSAHPLNDAESGLYDEDSGKRYHWFLRLGFSGNRSDTLDLKLDCDDEFVTLELNGEWDMERGKNFTIPLVLDYKQLLDGLKIDLDSLEMLDLIRENYINSVYVFN